MGVNKENIRFIIHYHMPMQIESYLQEIGRAGRDGEASIAILLYSPGDEQLPIQLAEGELPSRLQIDWLFSHLVHTEIPNDSFLKDNQYLREQGGFTEVQWRIMQDLIKNTQGSSNLEQVKHKIKEFVNERLKVKKESINFMKKWIKSNSCRRELILDYFEEVAVKESVMNCCDICGIQFDQYQTTESEQTKHMIEGMWKDYLANILLNSELS
jgi:ATP-dependent DNA helicase RecQ